MTCTYDHSMELPRGADMLRDLVLVLALAIIAAPLAVIALGAA